MSKPERYTFDDPTGYQGADFDYYDADETDKWVAELEAERDRLRELLSGWISAFDADDWATMDDVSAKTEAALEDTHE